MIRRLFTVARDRSGAAAIEFSIAVPILISMIWGIFEFGLLFEAAAGMQNALGAAARYATIYPTPTDTQISSYITNYKFGVQNGTWDTPTIVTNAAGTTKTITVTYHQQLNFLFFNGPNVALTRSKVVYLSK
jgi:Flp pilus assembly protein TadG